MLNSNLPKKNKSKLTLVESESQVHFQKEESQLPQGKLKPWPYHEKEKFPSEKRRERSDHLIFGTLVNKYFKRLFSSYARTF